MLRRCHCGGPGSNASAGRWSSIESASGRSRSQRVGWLTLTLGHRRVGESVRRAEQEARRRGAFMLKVEPNVEDGDATWLDALHKLGFRRNRFATHPRRSWVLDIRPSEDELLAGMKEKWRYNIRLAGRKGVQVR